MKRKSRRAIEVHGVEHLDKIGEIATYYGFTPMKSPAIIKSDLEAAKGLMDSDFIDDETERHGKLPLRVEEKIALIRTYHELDWNVMPQPVMLYLKDPCRHANRPASTKLQRSEPTDSSLKKAICHRYADLEILGSSGPIAEAALIQAGRTMLARGRLCADCRRNQQRRRPRFPGALRQRAHRLLPQEHQRDDSRMPTDPQARRFRALGFA